MTADLLWFYYTITGLNVATGGSNRPKPVTYKMRWDKGSVYEYYHVTGEALSSLRPDSLGLCCSPRCHSLQHGIDCHMSFICTGIFQYADDLFFIAPSVHTLQIMLNV